MSYLAVHEPTDASATGDSANDALLALFLTVGEVGEDDGVLLIGPL